MPNPIQHILAATQATNDTVYDAFQRQIAHLYQYHIFKNVLDLVATKCMQGLLSFRVQNARSFDLDEGNCKTFTMVKPSGLRNMFSTQRRYIISIKRVGSDVIMHEIAHMIEHEFEGELDLQSFAKTLLLCVAGDTSKRSAVQTAMRSILIQQVSSYPETQRQSELFARYFQLFASTKEVAFGKVDRVTYDILQLSQALEQASINLEAQFSKSKWPALIDKGIALESQQYLLPQYPKRTWADARIVTTQHHPAHSTPSHSSGTAQSNDTVVKRPKTGVAPMQHIARQNQTAQGHTARKWRSNIKSIKDV